MPGREYGTATTAWDPVLHGPGVPLWKLGPGLRRCSRRGGHVVVAQRVVERHLPALPDAVAAQQAREGEVEGGSLPGSAGAAQAAVVLRAEERRVGKECVSQGRTRWSRYH